MGVFSKDYEKEAEELWKEVEKDLRPKDGLQHALIIDSFFINKTLGLEKRNFIYNKEYTIAMNKLIEQLQKNGYDIIEIKVVSDDSCSSIRILIMYE